VRKKGEKMPIPRRNAKIKKVWGYPAVGERRKGLKTSTGRRRVVEEDAGKKQWKKRDSSEGSVCEGGKADEKTGGCAKAQGEYGFKKTHLITWTKGRLLRRFRERMREITAGGWEENRKIASSTSKAIEGEKDSGGTAGSALQQRRGRWGLFGVQFPRKEKTSGTEGRAAER